jgi:thioredoxin-related protein
MRASHRYTPGTRLAASLTAVVLVLLLGPVTTQATIEGGERHTGNPPWMEPTFVDLASELDAARAEGKTGLFVLYTTLGCSYCAEFVKRSLEDPRLQLKLRDNFATVGLEIFDDVIMTGPDGEDLPIKQFAEQEGAGMAPTLLFYDLEGQRLLRAVGYQTPERFELIMDYLISGAHQTRSFREYALEHTFADHAVYRTLADDPLFMKPPYALSRHQVPADRPMLVLFERTGCADCAEFHDEVLASPDVRERLKHFDVVRLDATDRKTPVVRPDGEASTPAAWFAEAGFSRLPAMLFVDENGKTVYQNDALTGRNRLLNMAGLVLEKKYLEGWSYQRYARTQAMARARAESEAGNPE